MVVRKVNSCPLLNRYSGREGPGVRGVKLWGDHFRKRRSEGPSPPALSPRRGSRINAQFLAVIKRAETLDEFSYKMLHSVGVWATNVFYHYPRVTPSRPSSTQGRATQN